MKAQIPLLTSKVEAANKAVETAQVVVSTKQEQVNAYAAKAAAADQATFGWQGLYNGIKSTLVWCVGILCFAAVAYLGIHFVLPSLAQEYPQAARLQAVYRTITSLASAHTITTTPPKP